jgi:hypothetical protein
MIALGRDTGSQACRLRQFDGFEEIGVTAELNLLARVDEVI